MVSKESVYEALEKVMDPELGVNIVDLGLVYEVKTENDKVYVKMTMTTPGCPMHTYLTETAKREIESIPEVKEAIVELVWNPPWSPERMSEKIKKKFGFE